MTDTVKLAAAIVVGYFLGRTKKGKMAARLALQLSGKNLRPADLAREVVIRLAKSPEGAELIAQLRGPVLDAGKQAAIATLEAQAGALADALHKKTEALSAVAGTATDVAEGAKGVAEDVTRTGGEAAGKAVEGATGTAGAVTETARSATEGGAEAATGVLGGVTKRREPGGSADETEDRPVDDHGERDDHRDEESEREPAGHEEEAKDEEEEEAAPAQSGSGRPERSRPAERQPSRSRSGR